MTIAMMPEADDAPLPAPTARVTADVLVHPSTGTVTTTMHFDGAPTLFVLLVLANRSVRCADGLGPEACDVRPVALPPAFASDPDDTRRLWAIHGDAPTVILEGVVSEDMHEVGMNGIPTHAALDLVELDVPTLLPTPLSFARDHVTLACSFRVETEPAVTWPPSSTYEGPFDAFEQRAMASGALVTEHVACGDADAFDVSYDEDFPGRERAMELAALACEGLGRMRARWGEPDGEGAFRLWLTPRRGLGYYLHDRTLVVPAYYGWTERPGGASWSTHEERADERMFTEIALLHELAHTWFSRAPRRWRGLHEGIAAYAALSTLVGMGRASRGNAGGVTDEILAGRAPAEALDAYAVGDLFLDGIERESGASAIDEVLRALRSREPRSDADFEALVAERLGALGTRWLDAARHAE